MSFNVEQLRREAICKHRMTMTEDEKEKERRLILAHNSVVETMIVAIQAAVRVSIAEDHMSTEICVIDPHKGADLHGLNFLTILKGTYRKVTGKRDWRQQRVAGIMYTPIEEVAMKLKSCGITKIVDESDASKSTQIHLKIFFDL